MDVNGNLLNWLESKQAENKDKVTTVVVSFGPKDLVVNQVGEAISFLSGGQMIAIQEKTAPEIVKPDFGRKNVEAKKRHKKNHVAKIRALLIDGKMSREEIAEKLGHQNCRTVGQIAGHMKREAAESRAPQSTNQPSRDPRGRLIWTNELLAELKKAKGAKVRAFADKYKISVSAARSRKYR